MSFIDLVNDHRHYWSKPLNSVEEYFGHNQFLWIFPYKFFDVVVLFCFIWHYLHWFKPGADLMCRIYLDRKFHCFSVNANFSFFIIDQKSAVTICVNNIWVPVASVCMCHRWKEDHTWRVGLQINEILHLLALGGMLFNTWWEEDAKYKYSLLVA